MVWGDGNIWGKMNLQDEKTFYRQLYQFADRKKSIVLEKSTERVFFRKEIANYNREVYRYLFEHPVSGIPRIHEMYESDGVLIVIEEYVSGETLEHVLEERELSEEEARKILLELCEILEILHKAEPPVIHRDIKPSNIILLHDGSVKLIDFDASRISHENKEVDTNLMGTPGYAAPEQYGFGQSEPRTDIYGVGILAKLMFGQHKKYTKFIEKATMIKAEERYNNILEFKKALMRVGEFFLLPPGFRRNEPIGKRVILWALYVYFLFRVNAFVAGIGQNGVPSGRNPYRVGDFITLYGIVVTWIWITADWPGLCKRDYYLRRLFLPFKVLLWAAAMIGSLLGWLTLYYLIVKGYEIIAKLW